MGSIRILPEGLINRIAAGEVVERPASIVKELVENSLDAGARAVRVRLRAGGKEAIEVSDDGEGMDRDDAVLSVERHATSKLPEEDALEAVRTLGFRGEALSSIAAVSHFVLRSARADGEGTEVEIDGGRLCGVKSVGHPRGTTVRVGRLFHNVPARRKFLRTEATELSHVLRWLSRYALANPDRRFDVRQGDRVLLELEPAPDRPTRIGQVLGRAAAERLLPFAWGAPGLSISGFAGRPVEASPRRDGQFLFVNGRAVQDRVLAHAIARAYGNALPAGQHAALLLFVEIEPSAVDVNVHPQKAEVRFGDGARVHEAVTAAVREALQDGGALPALVDLRPGTVVPRDEASVTYGPPAAPALAVADAPEPRPPERSPLHHATPLAQFRDSYIVAQDAEGLVVVDQHAAHERVLFETYLEQAERRAVEVQGLLFPLVIELGAADLALAEREREEFERLGFRFEPFGTGAVRLETLPAVAAEVEPERLFRELLGLAAEARSAVADSALLRRRLVTTAACHAAIKVNHPLGVVAMQALLDSLYATRNPTTCPHGRPVLFRLTLDELERAFRRR